MKVFGQIEANKSCSSGSKLNSDSLGKLEEEVEKPFETEEVFLLELMIPPFLEYVPVFRVVSLNLVLDWNFDDDVLIHGQVTAHGFQKQLKEERPGRVYRSRRKGLGRI